MLQGGRARIACCRIPTGGAPWGASSAGARARARFVWVAQRGHSGRRHRRLARTSSGGTLPPRSVQPAKLDAGTPAKQLAFRTAIGAEEAGHSHAAELGDDAITPPMLDADTDIKKAAFRRRTGAASTGRGSFIIPIAETTLTVGVDGTEPTLDIGFNRAPGQTRQYGMIAGSTNPYPFTVDGVGYLLDGLYGDDIGSLDSGTFTVSIRRGTTGADDLGDKLLFEVGAARYQLAETPTFPNASGVSEWDFTNEANPFGRTAGVEFDLRIWQAYEVPVNADWEADIGQAEVLNKPAIMPFTPGSPTAGQAFPSTTKTRARRTAPAR